MKPTVQIPDLAQAFKGTEEEIATALTETMGEVKAGLVADLGDDVVEAQLGRRLARTWAGRVYPASGSSLEPSVYVWSKAPNIIDAYARGATIYPTAGRKFLAIPTQDVPRKRQGNALTPAEVEARFGRRLQFISPADKGFWTPSIRKNGVGYLVLKGLTIRKASGRWRNASARELDKGRRGEKAISQVIMFILVPSVTVKRRLDLQATADRWAGRVQGVLNTKWRR